MKFHDNVPVDNYLPKNTSPLSTYEPLCGETAIDSLPHFAGKLLYYVRSAGFNINIYSINIID